VGAVEGAGAGSNSASAPARDGRTFRGKGNRLWSGLFIITLAFSPSGCKGRHLHRPAGVMRVGSVASLLADRETFLADFRILIRSDERGLSVMSTECTSDLSPLVLAEERGERFLTSPFSGSRYRITGEVLRGPAVAPLPYFRARLAAGEWGGPEDTLFVEMGVLNEVGPEWRLRLPSLSANDRQSLPKVEGVVIEGEPGRVPIGK
jgi:hypothetical protein